jgi:calcium-dependent protein kinase
MDDFDGGRFLIERTEDGLRKELGEGATGTVYLAKDLKENGAFVALKVLKSNFVEAVTNEVMGLAQLQHPNILKIVTAFFHERKNWVIVSEFCDGGDLAKFMAAQSSPQRQFQVAILTQLQSAVAYLHNKKMYHRDIKLNNAFLKKEQNGYIVKLGDFGLAKELSGDYQTWDVGTLAFMAPELFSRSRNTPYDEKVDIYALGLAFYMISAWQPRHNLLWLFQSQRRPIAMERSGDPSCSNAMEPELIGREMQQVLPLIIDMLQTDSDSRPSADEIGNQLSSIKQRMGV